jgi:hypothetical protein
MSSALAKPAGARMNPPVRTRRISPCVAALSGFDWSVRKFSGPELFSSVSRRGFHTGAAFIGEDEERSFLKRNGILGWIM